MNSNIPQNDSIINHLKFENGICHECNNVLPQYRYCVEMYGTKFKQNYGWYINKQGYEYGIKPISTRILRKECPQEILEVTTIDLEQEKRRQSNLRNKLRDLTDFRIKYHIGEINRKPRNLDSRINETRNELNNLDKIISKQERKIWKVVENEVRQKFGHYKVGSRWTSETILCNLIKVNYPEYTIKRHHRPEYLEGLELDIFIEEKEIGIEYQGVQHYEPVEHWGGEKGLRNRKLRDRRKSELCEENGIVLIYFKHDEELSDKIVHKKIDPYF